ncbi:PfkB family carbohydrate kinase [Streptomyces sp. NPDC004822]
MEPRTEGRPRGLFVGLCTLDVVQLVDRVPTPDEKVTALDQLVTAGGPAANAAVTFTHLGGAAQLLTGVGSHPLGEMVRADLDRAGVTVTDLAAGRDEPPAVSSVLVTADTGERAVASTNARAHRLAPPAPPDLDTLLAACDIVQFDGHHPAPALAAARAARAAGRRTVLDGGSWKPGTEDLLPYIDVAVCSAAFRPPGASSDTLRFLRDHGVTWAAVSHGPRPLVWAGPDGAGTVEVPEVPVVDTLGAGDVLHGALTHALARTAALTGTDFADALRTAATLAAHSCTSFGTRAWMREV